MCIRDSDRLADPPRGVRRELVAAAVLELVHGLHQADVAFPVSYTHLRAHETVLDLVCRLLLEKKKKSTQSHVL